MFRVIKNEIVQKYSHTIRSVYKYVNRKRNLNQKRIPLVIYFTIKLWKKQSEILKDHFLRPSTIIQTLISIKPDGPTFGHTDETYWYIPST